MCAPNAAPPVVKSAQLQPGSTDHYDVGTGPDGKTIYEVDPTSSYWQLVQNFLHPPSTPDPVPPPSQPGGGSSSVVGGGSPGGGGSNGALGSAGDFAGHPGYDNSGVNTGEMHMVQGPDGQTSTVPADQASAPGYIDLGPVGSGLLSAASMLAPGYAGIGLGALQAAMRGYNLTNTNTIRGTQGIPDTDIGQAVGAILGMNNYGGLDGNATVANPDQLGQRLNQVPAYALADDAFGQFGAPAETADGGAYQPGPGGILGWAANQLGLTDDASRALDPGAVDRLTGAGSYDDSTGWATDPGGDPLASASDFQQGYTAEDLAYMHDHPTADASGGSYTVNSYGQVTGPDTGAGGGSTMFGGGLPSVPAGPVAGAPGVPGGPVGQPLPGSPTASPVGGNGPSAQTAPPAKQVYTAPIGPTQNGGAPMPSAGVVADAYTAPIGPTKTGAPMPSSVNSGNAAGSSTMTQGKQVYDKPIGPTQTGAPMPSAPIKSTSTQMQVGGSNSGNAGGASSNEQKGGGNNNGQGSQSPGGGASQQGAASAGQSSGVGGASGAGNPGADDRTDHMAAGGRIAGDPSIGDNMPIDTTPGEYVVNLDSASAAPHLLDLINSDPQMAARLNAALLGSTAAQPGSMGGLIARRAAAQRPAQRKPFALSWQS